MSTGDSSRVIALLGAESTGKSDLADALARRLRRVQPCTAVPEYLREWCDTHERTPDPREQHHIAAEQQRRIEAALALAPDMLVVADTTPLMTAVYSEFVFQDHGLYGAALHWQQQAVGLTLVTALDLPWLPDGLQRDGPQVREPVDALIRAALTSAGIAYGVVHGEGPRRVEAALRAVVRWQPGLAAALDAGIIEDAVSGSRVRWRSRCLDCLDPDCERVLAGSDSVHR
ncbi:ATP-binding protein [Aquincola tertiaricarbonis]|uniref:ATP-binding protein n=1 Tax=Aquincola tertiaricarbonis TaxID=391953 RepID=A0ABY4SEC7_AQUTE|nr:ATP-binding protein [Aquincola tertiaricarbonis]URI11677.1 ATP-binding protein [Aquincola tertiaricarbonis]